MRLTAALLLLLALTGLAAGSAGCRKGRPLATGAQVGRVMGVVPYSMSDQPGEQPEGAFLCMSETDCTAVTTRDCCSGCSTAWLAVNHAAARATVRFHEQNPCPPDDGSCPEITCPDGGEQEAPSVTCFANRCALGEGG